MHLLQRHPFLTPPNRAQKKITATCIAQHEQPPHPGAYDKKTGQCTKSGRDMDHNACWLAEKRNWAKITTLLAQICLVIKSVQKKTSEKKEEKKRCLERLHQNDIQYIYIYYIACIRLDLVVEISLDLVNTDQAIMAFSQSSSGLWLQYVQPSYSLQIYPNWYQKLWRPWKRLPKYSFEYIYREYLYEYRDIGTIYTNLPIIYPGSQPSLKKTIFPLGWWYSKPLIYKKNGWNSLKIKRKHTYIIWKRNAGNPGGHPQDVTISPYPAHPLPPAKSRAPHRAKNPPPQSQWHQGQYTNLQFLPKGLYPLVN